MDQQLENAFVRALEQNQQKLLRVCSVYSEDGFILVVSKHGNQLKAQATGQQEFPVFPKSENVFYYKVVEAQLTFNQNEGGRIESVTLHQGGREIIGKKIEN